MSHFINYMFSGVYRNALRLPNGKSNYATICMNRAVRPALVLMKKLNKQISLHKAELEKKEKALEVIRRSNRMSNDEYFSTKKKVKFQKRLVWILILAELGINYVTTEIYLSQPGLVFFFLRIAIAAVVTYAGVASAEKFFELVNAKKQGKQSNVLMLVIYSLALLGVEVALYYFGVVRGHDFEGAESGSAVSIALILISMILPIIAGALRWDSYKKHDALANREKEDQYSASLKDDENELNNLLAQEDEIYREYSNKYWAEYEHFCLYKDRRNNSKTLFEVDFNHFAANSDSFQRELKHRVSGKLKTNQQASPNESDHSYR